MDRPSLEALIEAEDLGLDILHPGGLAITRELANVTGIVTGTNVLEIAAGTGETAHLLGAEYGARVIATDVSPRMLRKLRDKFSTRESAVQIVWADAHQLPFRNDSFDVALSECAVCQFDKLRALREMVRVVQPGGRVGIHDLCWKDGTPEALPQRLAEIEGERPETLNSWVHAFEGAGLAHVRGFDRSDVMVGWTRDARRAMGVARYLHAVKTVLRRWGLRGLRTVLESERIFASRYLGYAVVVGVKE